jgi:hypothetical protein
MTFILVVLLNRHFRMQFAYQYRYEKPRCVSCDTTGSTFVMSTYTVRSSFRDVSGEFSLPKSQHALYPYEIENGKDPDLDPKDSRPSVTRGEAARCCGPGRESEERERSITNMWRVTIGKPPSISTPPEVSMVTGQ